MGDSVDNQSFIEPLNLKDGRKIYINPGTGPVDGATEENAIENMKQFIIDSVADRFERQPNWDSNGRFGFAIFCDKYPEQYIEVEMPGLPLDQVRYTGNDGQNPWHFPRLYVSGSSWLWKFAILKDYDWTGEDE